MVGILIVSHSPEIARGTKKLAEQMIQEPIPLKAVGGTDDGRLGTNANLIYEALDKMEKEDGIIILTDLGSANMNVQLALEWFSEKEREKFKIANAPLVEGAVLGVVESSLEHNLEEVLQVIESEDILIKNNS
ncbi:PTS-dependent dihydroxyacetone kinase phosphotransferase subunit DhaM [Clostridium sp. D2Q-14]|uniref:dihydroxyacetone kinase phosphoryl donor subunit DhaM n=1 Tax=Anaeromonas gelatinilytica TaxID=2683194 RepID=UPI00193C27DE|nr:dihydroxyacetone kinase phosphoryl donor subunit DhaM [Anaeromonas gelatinilytica]MBS4534519.1 PTS-dependent dihydroxyacetone kinase phosphotransferase subunit DhaM [Anaeromonas gelatinilytica]